MQYALACCTNWLIASKIWVQCGALVPQAGHAHAELLRGQEMQRKFRRAQFLWIARLSAHTLPGRKSAQTKVAQLKMAAHAHAEQPRPRNAWKIPSPLNFYWLLSPPLAFNWALSDSIPVDWLGQLISPTQLEDFSGRVWNIFRVVSCCCNKTVSKSGQNRILGSLLFWMECERKLGANHLDFLTKNDLELCSTKLFYRNRVISCQGSTSSKSTLPEDWTPNFNHPRCLNAIFQHCPEAWMPNFDHTPKAEFRDSDHFLKP